MEQTPAWYFDEGIKKTSDLADKRYLLIKAGQDDVQKVVSYYQSCPVEGYEISRVEIIYNPKFNRSFDLELSRLEEKEGNAAFDPPWQTLSAPEERQKVYDRWLTFSLPYADHHYPHVKLLPAWHGTKPAYLDSIFRVGYSNLSYTDDGYFGKGLYSTREADYAYRAYCQGALIVNWVAFYSALPVIEGDMPLLRGKANYGNFDAHFVPVKPLNPDNLDEKVFYPCYSGEEKYHEMVVFQTSACLPRYLVELQKTLLKSPDVKLPEPDTSFSWQQAFQCCEHALLEEDRQVLHLTFPVPSESYWTVWHEHISAACETLKEKTDEKINQSRTADDQVQIISLKTTPAMLSLYKDLSDEKKEGTEHINKNRWIFIKSYQKSSLLSPFFQSNPHAKFYKDLTLALEMQNRKKLETLLKENKPLVLYKDERGNSFLHLLAQTKLTDYLQPFLQWGFQLTAANHFGDIPLHYACNAENCTRDPEATMVKALIDTGSPLDIPNKQLQTPLMVAAKNGHLEAVRTLLKAGANPAFTDQNGQTALQLAQSSGLPETSSIIKILSSNKNCLIQ